MLKKKIGGDHLSGVCSFGHRLRDIDIAQEASWVDALLCAQGYSEDIKSDGDD